MGARRPAAPEMLSRRSVQFAGTPRCWNSGAGNAVAPVTCRRAPKSQTEKIVIRIDQYQVLLIT